MPAKPRTARVRKPGNAPEDVVEATPAEPVAEEAAREEAASEKPAAKKGAGKNEGDVKKMSPRDLRRARRKARRLGIEAADDHEAARLLAERGIDITSRESVLDIVPPSGAPAEGGDDGVVQLPAEMIGGAVAKTKDAPPPAPLGEDERTREIAKIQRQLVKRRRRRLAFLFLKIAFFVMLPTFLVGHYYYNTATEMYETSSEFVIQKSEATGSTGIGGLFSGTGFATSQDSITVQGFLTSREALGRLDEDLGFIAHYQQEWIDDIQRLPSDASDEKAFKMYKKRVKVGFDPTEGIIRMQVVAATPEASEQFSKALIGYAEERIDNLSARVREDQMAGALASYEEAERAMIAAQQSVLELQQMRGVLSAEVEISAQMTIINSLELEREQKQLDLAEIMANARPNQARAAVLQADIARLNDRIEQLRSAMTQSTDTNTSLARITGELKVAEADLANRQLMMQSALQQLETARIEANRQVRYLSMGVSPVAPDVASYPRKLENTVLAFVIFLSLYILVSLTVSILREQVSV